jgi:hypothetical protein
VLGDQVATARGSSRALGRSKICMFDRAQLEEAVEIGNRAYRLIRWVGDAIERGFITFTSAHEYASDAEAAAAWIAEHYHNIPPDSRPPAKSGVVLARFANYFASYLNTSFELLAGPGVELRSRCECRCWCCTYLAAAPHLRTRRVTTSDKKRAFKLKLDHLRQLALDRSLSVSESALEGLAIGPKTSEQVALLAYGTELLARCSGRPSSPAALALWRQFAWSRAGSPKRGFVLRGDAILKAEAEIVRALETAAA